MPHTTHRCFRPGCGAKIPRSAYACPQDWDHMPDAIRNAVTAAWRTGSPHADGYPAAAAAANAWWEGR